MTQPIITLDIETTPSVCPEVHALVSETIKPPASMKKAETIAAWEANEKPKAIHEALLKTALDGALGNIAVIGVALNNDEPITFFVDSPEPHEHEVKVLSDFFHFVSEAYTPSSQRAPLFVGHNIVGFDLKFIFQRAVVLGIKPPACIPFHAKPWDDQVWDNMLRWSGGDRFNFISQDKLSRILGNKGKGDIDGSMVYPLVSSGRIAEVAEYCADDVLQARSNYKRMTFADYAEPFA